MPRQKFKSVVGYNIARQRIQQDITVVSNEIITNLKQDMRLPSLLDKRDEIIQLIGSLAPDE